MLGKSVINQYICIPIKNKMENEVKKVFENMSDSELSQAIYEMKKDGSQGIIREEGVIQNKCKIVREIAGGTYQQHLMMVQVSILQEAAYRFTPSKELYCQCEKPWGVNGHCVACELKLKL